MEYDMDKRAFKRVPAKIEVKFLCNHMDYAGTITNISENGMYITTNEMCSPFDSQFEVLIIMEDDMMQVPVNLCRIILSPNSDDGIGVNLSNPSEEYEKFVNSIKSSVTS